MALTRREFLRASGLSAAYMALPAWLGACARGDAPARPQPLATPVAWATDAPAAEPLLLHLLQRLTYGPAPGDIRGIAALGAEAFIEQQLHPEQIDDSELERRLAGLETLTLSSAELFERYPPQGKPGPRVIIQQLQQASLLRAVYSRRQLQELMVDFWSNYFNIFIGKNQVKWLKTADDRDVIRRHALGKFRDLLLASAQSPAMLVYLDNAQNTLAGKRSGINENYARELLELHTIGADAGYGHEDIVAVARALTGWSVGLPKGADGEAGRFLFRPRLHDDGEKRIAVLDLTLPGGGGLRDGEALIERLAADERTAARIAYKLCARFAGDDPPPALVARAAQTFKQSDGDIRATLGLILRSDEFKAAAGQKVKLPLHMLISMLRALGVQTEVSRPLLELMRQLGQPFFGWPAPNGYPQLGAAWINTSGLLARWNAAFALAEGRVPGVSADLRALIALDNQNAAAGQLVDAMTAALLHAPVGADARAALVDYASAGAGAAARLNERAITRKLPALAGLVLASPLFQVY